MHYNLLSLAVHGAFTSFYRCLKVTQLDNFDSNSSCARDGVGVIVVGVVNSYSFFGWDLFTTSSKCSKIRSLHQLKFKTWKMRPFHRILAVEIRDAMQSNPIEISNRWDLF